jgi:hypothetical protein
MNNETYNNSINNKTKKIKNKNKNDVKFSDETEIKEENIPQIEENKEKEDKNKNMNIIFFNEKEKNDKSSNEEDKIPTIFNSDQIIDNLKWDNSSKNENNNNATDSGKNTETNTRDNLSSKNFIYFI